MQIALGQRADCSLTHFFILCEKSAIFGQNLGNFGLKTLLIDLKRVVLSRKNVNFDQNTVSFGRKNAIFGRNAKCQFFFKHFFLIFFRFFSIF